MYWSSYFLTHGVSGSLSTWFHDIVSAVIVGDMRVAGAAEYVNGKFQRISR